MRRTTAAAAALLALLTLTGCTPRADGRCTNPGETVTTDAGVTLRCQTREGDHVPRWTVVE